jgi:hypothetical protein
MCQQVRTFSQAAAATDAAATSHNPACITLHTSIAAALPSTAEWQWQRMHSACFGVTCRAQRAVRIGWLPVFGLAGSGVHTIAVLLCS